MKTRITTSLAGIALVALALVGCSTTPTGTTEDDAPAAAVAGDSITISDAWVKSAASGMSAAFGELVNDSDQDVTVVSATSSASPMIELHETVMSDSGEMIMQPKEGGFTIPAGGSFMLEPGGNHIMLMDVTTPLKAGDEAEFTLEFSDGSTYTFTAPAKDYTGADENYVPGDDGMDMGDGE